MNRRVVATLGIVASLCGLPLFGQIPPPASGPSATDPPLTKPVSDPPLDAPPPPAPTGVTPAPAATQPDAAPPADQAGPGRPQLSLAEILERVKAMIEAENYDDSTTVLTNILRNDPENFDARLLMAKVHEGRRDYMSARTIYNELLKIQPNHFDLNMGLGRIFVLLQYWRQAPRYLDAADRVARPEQKAEVKILLAITHRGAGDLKQALAAAEAAVAAEPENYDARSVLIEIRLDTDQFDQAAADARVLIEIATRQVETKRGDPEALRRLSQSYDAFLNVLRRHYTTFYVRDAAGEFTDELLPGKEKEAAASLQQIVDVMLRATEVRRVLSYHDVLVIAEKSASLDPTNTEVLHHEALLLLNTDQTQAAIARFQRILEVDPNNAAAIRELNRLSAPLTSQPAAAQPLEAAMP